MELELRNVWNERVGIKWWAESRKELNKVIRKYNNWVISGATDPVKGVKLAKLGQKRYNPEIVIKRDPRNRTYYWIGTGDPKEIGDKDSDVLAFKQGFLTITPLHADSTDYTAMKSIPLKNMISWMSHETF